MLHVTLSVNIQDQCESWPACGHPGDSISIIGTRTVENIEEGEAYSLALATVLDEFGLRMSSLDMAACRTSQADLYVDHPKLRTGLPGRSTPPMLQLAISVADCDDFYRCPSEIVDNSYRCRDRERDDEDR